MRPREMTVMKGVAGSTRSTARPAERLPSSQATTQLLTLEMAAKRSFSRPSSFSLSLGNITSQRISGGVSLSMRVCTSSTYCSKMAFLHGLLQVAVQQHHLQFLAEAELGAQSQFATGDVGALRRAPLHAPGHGAHAAVDHEAFVLAERAEGEFARLGPVDDGLETRPAARPRRWRTNASDRRAWFRVQRNCCARRASGDRR
jgi:hypothetical protein